MPRVIVTAQIQDPVKWEAGFRTHGELFRKTYTLRAPVHYTIAGNEVAICMEPENLKSFKQAMESQATLEAMAFDRSATSCLPTNRGLSRHFNDMGVIRLGASRRAVYG
jgi:hypothetical protein